MSVPTLLCASNFPSSTGYAWELIGALFARVAEVLAERGVRTLVAYPVLDGLPRALDGGAAKPVACDFRLQSAQSVREALALVRSSDVRAVWLIDQPMVSPAYALLHAAGVRRVIVHDHSSGARPVPRGARRLAKAMAVRLPWVSADLVVAVSHYVAERQRTAGMVPTSRVRLVPNPVSPPAPSRSREVLRAELGILPSRRLVAAAGRLTPEKGFADLLRAADGLPEDVEVVVFGDGPERGALQRLRGELRAGSRVHLPGHRSHSAEWMAAADVCVVPSRWDEAFCLAAVEALAHGRPTVATRVGAIPEFVRDGETGLLVPPANPPALSGAIRRLLEAPEMGERLGSAGQAWVLREYTWPRAVAGMLEILAPAFPEPRAAAVAIS
jgi:glycosyltransferase involved in cell wall biosynthesis